MNKELNDLVNQLNEIKLVEKLNENSRFGDVSQVEISTFLNTLSESGETNMTEAVPLIEKEFGISESDAKIALDSWVKLPSIKEATLNEETRALQIAQILKNKILRMKQKAKDPYWTDNDPDQAAMYIQDAKDLEAILAAFLAKNYTLVDKLITNLDTAVRDEIPVKLLGAAGYEPFNVKTQRGYRA